MYTAKYHISMHFLIKIIFFHFPSKEKISYFPEKRNTIFPDITKKPCSSANFLKRPLFQNIWRKHHIFRYFFWERSCFLLRLKNKIIFSGKRNIIFPDNSRKIIFQRDFFGKTIFPKHLEKANPVFCAVYWHSCF